MNKNEEKKLRKFVRKHQKENDRSHDFQHVLRVRNIAVKVGKEVGADLDVVIPAALFHDIVVYQKDTDESRNESEESAAIARKKLEDTSAYPEEKISEVEACIKECSFSKGLDASSLESKVLQDADRLEATGAIAIMRTFASCEHMDRPFYPPEDPFCEEGAEEYRSGIDLFYNRLLVVKDVLHTDMAKSMAERRIEFLENFLDQLETELSESGIL